MNILSTVDLKPPFQRHETNGVEWWSMRHVVICVGRTDSDLKVSWRHDPGATETVPKVSEGTLTAAIQAYSQRANPRIKNTEIEERLLSISGYNLEANDPGSALQDIVDLVGFQDETWRRALGS